MKRTLIIGLAILKVTVVDTAEAKANLWLERVSKQPALEQVRQETNEQQAPKTPAQAVKNPQPKTQPVTEETTLEPTQLSERDRLIQERFLIKIIPAQNQ